MRIIPILLLLIALPIIPLASATDHNYFAKISEDRWYNISNATAISYSTTCSIGTFSTTTGTYLLNPNFTQIGNYSCFLNSTDGATTASNWTTIQVYDPYTKSFQDVFNDASLNSSFWIGTNNANASIVETLGVKITDGNVNGAAIISPIQPFNQYISTVIFNVSKMTGVTGSAGVYILNQTPTIRALPSTNTDVKISIYADRNTTYISAGFFTEDGFFYMWNISKNGWTNSSVDKPGIPATLGRNYTAMVESNFTSYRLSILNSSNNSILLQSGWIDKSNVRDGFSDDYMAIGDLYTGLTDFNLFITGFNISYLNLNSIDRSDQYRRCNILFTTAQCIDALNETNSDFVFQAWMRQAPMWDTCALSDNPAYCTANLYSYQDVSNMTRLMHTTAANKDILIGGGFLAEFLNPVVRDERTGTTYDRNQTWNMTLDPSIYGLSQNRTQFQLAMAVMFEFTNGTDPGYSPKDDMIYFYPDINNQTVYDLYFGYAAKQIDSGIDVLWIDGLYGQPELMGDIAGNYSNGAVNSSMITINRLIRDIQEYGVSKGKYIHVMSWVYTANFHILFQSPYGILSPLDGFMTSVGASEFVVGSPDAAKWTNITTGIRNAFGHEKRIFSRIDYGNAHSPLYYFSQELSQCEASNFLINSSVFFDAKDMQFIYPIQGGNMNSLLEPPDILAYGLYDIYDSRAPEFMTYSTIRDISNGVYTGYATTNCHPYVPGAWELRTGVDLWVTLSALLKIIAFINIVVYIIKLNENMRNAEYRLVFYNIVTISISILILVIIYMIVPEIGGILGSSIT